MIKKMVYAWRHDFMTVRQAGVLERHNQPGNQIQGRGRSKLQIMVRGNHQGIRCTYSVKELI